MQPENDISSAGNALSAGREAGKYNLIVLLGPTAVGKTSVGVKVARTLNGEIISADSRQVYRNLDIGTGKDLKDYAATETEPAVPYHLIDIADVSYEYNVCDFQSDFYTAFSDITARGKLPIVVGGTGLYIDSILRNYDFLPVPENTKYRADLENKTLEELVKILLTEKPDFHTTANLRDKERVIRALEIVYFMRSTEADEIRKKLPVRPEINPLVVGTTLPRERVRQKICARLKERLDEGMVDEVRSLHQNGASWERLLALGLEYRFVSEFLQGKIESEKELYEKLSIAIGQFAKRQETWFRGMEKKGVHINWLKQTEDVNERAEEVVSLSTDWVSKTALTDDTDVW